MHAAPVAIVSGASRGIGAAIAQQLASDGYRLLLTARSQEGLKALVDTLPDATPCAVDLREHDAAQAIVDAALQSCGRIDALVNCAGAAPRGDVLSFTDEDWQAGFDLKFFGAMRLCRAAWPHLMLTQGAIVNIAGIGGRTASAEFAIGGAINAALLNLTKSLADRGVGEGVRVNAVNPSTIATTRMQVRIDRLATERGITVQNAAEALATELGVSRFGRPAEIASVVAFLLSDAASYMQGAIVDVDGGQTRTL